MSGKNLAGLCCSNEMKSGWFVLFQLNEIWLVCVVRIKWNLTGLGWMSKIIYCTCNSSLVLINSQKGKFRKKQLWPHIIKCSKNWNLATIQYKSIVQITVQNIGVSKQIQKSYGNLTYFTVESQNFEMFRLAQGWWVSGIALSETLQPQKIFWVQTLVACRWNPCWPSAIELAHGANGLQHALSAQLVATLYLTNRQISASSLCSFNPQFLHITLNL
jgi:hypothetical protein